MKQKSPLETNQLYKLQKKLETEQAKLQKSIQKRQLYYEKKKRTALDKAKVTIVSKYDKKLSKQVRKITKSKSQIIKNLEREIKGHKQVEYKQDSQRKVRWMKAT